MMTPEQIAAMKADAEALRAALAVLADTSKIEIDRLTKALRMIAELHPETVDAGPRKFAKEVLKRRGGGET